MSENVVHLFLEGSNISLCCQKPASDESIKITTQDSRLVITCPSFAPHDSTTGVTP
jgi:hypothetical protein